MDLLKTPSVQSLVDSDIGSIESLQSLDIEELDETEYALPPSETPSLAEAMQGIENDVEEKLLNKEPVACSALQIDFLQAISQQLTHAEERSSAGSPTTLSVGIGGKLAAGTAHGHILSFQDQVLRWVCDANVDRGAVTCMAYNGDATRLLVGFARGLICQYESSRGIVLRRVTPGGGIWGALRIAWADSAGLALDTGGSVWLIKFSRPLGVRSARTSCLFSGARGEVVAMTARNASILALATLSRVIAVAGGRAAGIRLVGPPNTLPALTWCESDAQILVCARARILQWVCVIVSGSSVSLRLIKRVELKSSPLWLGWLGNRLAIFDADENLHLWDDDEDQVLDLSEFQPIYATAFFKGVWTDGRVSRALSAAGASALGGASSTEGAFTLLGRRGVIRVRPRDVMARTRALAAAGHITRALRLLCKTSGLDNKQLAGEFIADLTDKPSLLSDPQVAEAIVNLCLQYKLKEDLWGRVWEVGVQSPHFVETVGNAAARGALIDIPPPPDISQILVERLAEIAPELVERVVAALPLTALDPHRATVFARDKRMWRTVGAIAAALGGVGAAMRELTPKVGLCRSGGLEAECTCAGDALLLIAADGLAGRAAAGVPLPEHARPAARHDALQILLSAEGAVKCVDENTDGVDNSEAPLRVLLRHDARAVIRLLQMCARDPPFTGPLGKQNRLRVVRSLLQWATELQVADREEILDFITGQLHSGALPQDREVCSSTRALAASTPGELSDRSWQALLDRPHTRADPSAQLEAASGRPRVLWRLYELIGQQEQVLEQFFNIQPLMDADIDQLFEYIRRHITKDDIVPLLKTHLHKLVEARPRAAAAILTEHCPDLIELALENMEDESVISFGECLLEVGQLQAEKAILHLRNLCTKKPSAVTEFLNSHAGFIKPEDALAIVRRLGPLEAEPICLEASGDPECALEVILKLLAMSNDEDKRKELIRQSRDLCTRVAASVPVGTAARMWMRLLNDDISAEIPPSAVFDAVEYIPLDTLVAHTCKSSLQVALALLYCANNKKTLWKTTSRIVGRELHENLARALRIAGRALAVHSVHCSWCGGALALRPVTRMCQCGNATHADCVADSTRCSSCSSRLKADVRCLSLSPISSSEIPIAHSLRLVAPPRPDLEGIV